MSTPFQNRLVGTVIVAAAIIIFLPDLLDGEKKSYQADFEAIPEAPSFNNEQAIKRFPQEKLDALPKEVLVDEKALDEEIAVENVAQNSDKVKVAVLAKSADFTSKTKASTLSAKNAGIAKLKTKSDSTPKKAVVNFSWVIQLGSFRHKKNVEKLLIKLKSNGYTAFTKPIKTKKGTLTKVFIGPELRKEGLEKKLPELKRLTNVQGKLARFYPSK